MIEPGSILWEVCDITQMHHAGNLTQLLLFLENPEKFKGFELKKKDIIESLKQMQDYNNRLYRMFEYHSGMSFDRGKIITQLSAENSIMKAEINKLKKENLFLSNG